MADASTLPVLVEEHGGIAALLPCDPTAAANDVWASLDIRTDEGRMAIVRCLQGSDKKGAQVYGKRINIEHIVCHPTMLTDKKTGEKVAAVRSVLVSKNGERVAFISLGIFKSLGILSMLWDKPPWIGGKEVDVVLSKTGSGGNWLTLEPVR